jgi:hypothetical protein
MAATSVTGVGQGSVDRVKNLILNGDVKSNNIVVNDLKNYRIDIGATGNIAASGSIHGASLNVNGAVVVSGNISTTGNLVASGSIHGASLNVNGASTFSGNISATGFIRGNVTGQLLNTSLNVSTGTYTSTASGYTDIMSVSYTPVRSGSKIVVNFDAGYSMNGTNSDSFGAQIAVSGNPIITRTQAFVSGGNGDTMRGNVLFPISYLYQSATAAATTIAVKAALLSGDDTLTVDKTQAMLTITEYVS